ncbi:hypothetical protein OO012_00145 [Rhodobacteraceae bacterium KMM 6894]|nr:hypothetical protein [Rhodobacteraceae bacterium KMM 6894]
MAVITGPLANRYNIDDLISPLFNLDGARGIEAITVAGRSFVYVAGFLDDGFSSFELLSDGSLSNIENIDSADLSALESATNIQTVTTESGTYLYVNGGSTLNVFEVASDGTLTHVQTVNDDATLNLNITFGKMAVTEVAGVTYLVASGALDDGISAFAVAADGTLANTGNISDATAGPTSRLDLPGSLASITVGGNSFVFVPARDNSTVTSIQVNPDGTLSQIDQAINGGILNLSNVQNVATTTINGVGYVFASSFLDEGISVFSVSSAGVMTNVFNIDDSPEVGLRGVRNMTPYVLEGETFLSVETGGAAAAEDQGVVIFHVAPGGTLTQVDRMMDDVPGLELNRSSFDDFIMVDGVPMLVVTGTDDDGFSSFEIGGNADMLIGTMDDDTILGLADDDTIYGNGGDDSILGGDDDDALNGGAGDDTLRGQDGDDLIYGGVDPSVPTMSTVRLNPDVTDNQFLFVDDLDFTAGGNITIEFLYQAMDEEPSERTTFFSYEASTGTNHLGLLARHTVDENIWFYSLGNSYNTGVPSEMLQDGLMHRVSFVQDSSDDAIRLYIDGTLVHESLFAEVGIAPGGELTFGQEQQGQGAPYDNNRELKGDLADIRVWSDARTDQEIADNAFVHLEDPASEAGLYANWRPDPANTSQIIDVTGGDSLILGADGGGALPAISQFTDADSTDDGNDTVYDGRGDDTVYLGGGDDFVLAGGGADEYHGGRGSDFIDYRDSSGGVDIDLAADSATGSWANNDTIDGFESVGGSDTGDDTLRGTERDNQLIGRGGDDRVYDRGGDDFVSLGSGNDYVRVGGGEDEYRGGSGTDYISYYDSSGGVSVNLETNAVSGSWASNDTIIGFESISGSRTGDDTITGTDGANVIRTYGGDDRVFDQSGTDSVSLGAGDDYVRAGGGADSYDGGAGDDYISYYDSSGGVHLDFRTDFATGSWANNDVVENFEGASGSNTGNDTLRGTDGTSILRGYGGNDRLHGHGGDDSMLGGSGDDSLYGASGADTMRGGSGSDFLDGGGGSGTDLLYGDAGADVFHFDRSEGNDVVRDFENNIDVIEFDNFAGFTTANDALAFATETGGDVLFDFGADGTLLVENATIAQLGNDIDIV